MSAITSLPYSISRALNVEISIMTFATYSAIVGIQFIIKGKHRTKKDLLQLLVCSTFSLILGIVRAAIPFQAETLWQNLILTMVGLTFNGMGVALTVDMKLVPGPPEGLLDAVCMITKKELGLMKNIQDLTFVSLAIAIDLIFSGKIVSVGLGTVIAMVYVGRCVFAFNYFFKDKIQALAGLTKEATQ